MALRYFVLVLFAWISRCNMQSTSTNQFDICVVGSGLIGSSVAKYLSKTDQRVCLIGVFKTISEQTVRNREVFGSWNDISRASHTLFPEIVWAYLARESIEHYRFIEEESGIQFFDDLGYLVLSDSPSYIERNAHIGRRVGLGESLELFTNKTNIESRFPFIQLQSLPLVQGLFEQNEAGIINPARLVEAQRVIYKKNGGTFLDETVVNVTRIQPDSLFNVTTDKGTIVNCKKVVICAGAFLGQHQLLPDDVKLDVTYRPALITRIRVDPGPFLQSLNNTPPFIYIHAKDEEVSEAFAPSREKAIDTPTFGSSIFSFPPILYPDGHYYLKIGYLDDTSEFENRSLHTPEAVMEVFNSKDVLTEQKRSSGQHLFDIAKRVFKGFHGGNFEVDVCCWVGTPDGKPYIAQVSPNWYVVTGDNGVSAKSADELGRMTSQFVLSDTTTKVFPVEEDIHRKIAGSTAAGYSGVGLAVGVAILTAFANLL